MNFPKQNDHTISITTTQAELSKSQDPESTQEPDTQVQQVEAQPKGSWRDIFHFMKRSHIPILIVGLVSTALASALMTGNAIFLGFLFQAATQFGSGTLTGEQALAQVAKWSVVLVAMATSIGITQATHHGCWILIGELQAKEVRSQVFQALLMDKDMEWFDMRKDGVSSLISRIRTQTRELQTMLTYSVGHMIFDMLSVIFSIVAALIMSWKLTLVLLATVPVSGLALALITRKLDPAIRAQKVHLAESSKYSSSSLAAVDIVKVYNGFDHEVWQYLVPIRKAAKNYLIQARCNAGQMGYVKFWIISLFVGGFSYGIVLSNQGVSTGSILTTFYATLTALQAVESILPDWLVLAKGMSAAAWLHHTLGGIENGKVVPMTGSAWPAGCKGDIKLDDVSFSYPSNREKIVLQPTAMSFAAGDITFLVGRSGSGKSTVGNLLVQFYQPLKGDIWIDGVALRTIDPKWIRQNITLVQQSSVLFDDTFFNNVALGDRKPSTVSRKAVDIACAAAVLQSTVSRLPDGMETLLGAGGVTLSGGQMQRLALARAKLRDPPVLILDEVTSGLDQESRTLIMQAIRFWRRGKTTIIITHDVSQISDEDQVFVMDQGMVVQSGNRHVLEHEYGLFSHLVQSSGDTRQGTRSPPPPSPGPARAAAPPPSAGERGQRQMQRSQNIVTRKHSVSEVMDIVLGSNIPDRRLSRRSHFGTGNLHPSMGMMKSVLTHSSVGSVDDDPISHGRFNTESYSREVLVTPPRAPPGRRSSMTAISPTLEVDMEKEVAFLQQSAATECRRPHPLSPAAFGDIKYLDNDEKRQPQQENGEEEEDVRPARALRVIYGSIWPCLDTSHRFRLIAALICAILVGAANPAFSFLFAKLLAIFSYPGPERTGEIAKRSPYLTAVVLVEALSTYFARYLFESVAQVWVNYLRIEAMKRILRQPKHWHSLAENSRSRISAILDRDGEEMRNILGRAADVIISVVVMVISSAIWALVLSWKLTLVTLAAGPLVIIVSCYFSIITTKYERRSNEVDLTITSILFETLQNIRVVRAFTLESYFSVKYETRKNVALKVGMSKAMFSSPLFGATQAAPIYLTAIVFYYGTVLLTNGEFELENIFQVVNLLLFSIGTAASLLQTVPQLSAGAASATAVMELAELPMYAGHEHSGTIRVNSPFPVSMKDIQFRYPNVGGASGTVLRGVNLTIRANESVAIVGSSGCGKSTVASLLLRLYAPSEPDMVSSTIGDSTLKPRSYDNTGSGTGNGRHSPPTPALLPPPGQPGLPLGTPTATALSKPAPLTFAGVPADLLSTAHLRKMISYVPQHPHLFPATLLDNITYGLPTTSPLRDTAAVGEVAAKAGIHELAMSLPLGYKTRVGEGGVLLSGGQTQRVGVARALLRLSGRSGGVGAGLIIMDEPTAALDARGAEEVRDVLRGLMRQSREGVKQGRAGLGLVVITHCRETMKMADRVVVLDHGVVVEDGGYEELLQRSRRFRELVGEIDG